MKRKSLLVALIISMGVFMFACKPSDSKIQQAANEKLSVIPGISADVKNGVVTLSGEVSDEAARAAAEDALKDVKGVKSVDNKIMVKAPEPAPAPVVINPDDLLKRSLDSAYAAAGFSGISVTILDGVVTLEGTASKADLQKIVRTAQESRPKKVVNNIKVK
ncbi:BON domain-containing protein [Chitinophaga sp. sic0106]|uniref:BON domain-containing protein n=1 Tax=Chitinophaga sp. sic0106 TaxID=2854785 RepID=UPI001C441FCF|nr:BON domain-containing protein [Chitinophaga sp. sic0106]MBV7528891.1 BON domain-containing protein [Chitinophaga sp. sic0106]